MISLGKVRLPVMPRHLLMRAVQIRFIAARSSYTRTRVIRHQQPCGALEELEGPDVAVTSVRQILCERNSCKGVRAGTEPRSLTARPLRDVIGSIQSTLLRRSDAPLHPPHR